MRRIAVWVALVGSVLACVATATACWLQTSFVGWLTNVGVLATLFVVTVGYDRPGRRLLRAPFGWVYPLCGVGGAASVVELPDLRWPHVTSTAMGGVVVTMVVLAYVVAGLREPGRSEPVRPLAFPLTSGRWTVVTGGVAALNHHLASPEQAGAVDLVAVRRDGARASGVCPDDLEDYEAYGQEVVSPCDGLVVMAVDSEPDQVSGRLASAAGWGNQVRIDNGCEIVHLAHLRSGSLRVSVGDEVVARQPVGEVGSSGRSTEPHLHIHAERLGRGVRLRFADLHRGRLRPGVTVGVAAARAGDRADGRG